MKPRRALAMTHCPNCGARIVPTPKEFKQWRKAAGLTQRQMAARLKITAAHVAYLEHGKRSPSAALVKRYRKFMPSKERCANDGPYSEVALLRRDRSRGRILVGA